MAIGTTYGHLGAEYRKGFMRLVRKGFMALISISVTLRMRKQESLKESIATRLAKKSGFAMDGQLLLRGKNDQR